MSREIEFRVWFEGDIEPTFYISDDLFDDSWTYHEVAAIEQYTGLKDKHGTKVYEGDLLKCGAYIGEVKYLEDLACFCVGDYTPIYTFLRIKDKFLTTCEVIGNIHKNPELLEGEK